MSDSDTNSDFDEKEIKNDKDRVVFEQLGNGSYGQVYRVVETSDQQEYAVKYFPKHVVSSMESAQCEIEVFKMFKAHPNIVTLKKNAEDVKYLKLFYQPVCGMSLFDYLKLNQRMTESECSTCLQSVIEILMSCHAQKIMHLDLKPENLLLPRGETMAPKELYLCDFGLADWSNFNNKPWIDKGTLDYLSPEQIEHKDFSYRVELWAIGVLTYELLEGFPPFSARTASLTVEHIKKIQYSFSESLSLSDEAKDFIGGLLVQDPNQRRSLESCLQHPFLK